MSSSIQPCIILEMGSAFIRVGFSGEPTPRHILPSSLPFTSPTAHYENYKNRILSTSEWEDILEPLMEHILIDKLLISNWKQRRFFVLESNVISPTSFRKALANILLHRISISSDCSLLFWTGTCSALYSLGVGCSAGVVADIGRRESRSVALFDGMIIPRTWNAVASGYDNIVDSFHQNHLSHLSFADARAIMDQCIQQRASSLSSSSFTCRIPSSNISISIPTQEFERCWDEICFDYDNPHSVVYAILSTMTSIPIDLRKKLVSNVLLIGGGAFCIMQCFRQRFIEALVEGMQNPPFVRLKPLAKLIVVPCGSFAPNVMSWVGASIMASALPLQNERWVTREDGEE